MGRKSKNNNNSNNEKSLFDKYRDGDPMPTLGGGEQASDTKPKPKPKPKPKTKPKGIGCFLQTAAEGEERRNRGKKR